MMKLEPGMFVERGLSRGESYYGYVLESLVEEEIAAMRAQLNTTPPTDSDPDSTETIQEIIDRIRNIEGRTPGLFAEMPELDEEAAHLKKRLTHLLDQLRNDARRIEQTIEENRRAIHRTEEKLTSLHRIAGILFGMDTFDTQERAQIFLKAIEGKIQLLEHYTLTLSMEGVTLMSKKHLYKHLLRQGA